MLSVPAKARHQHQQRRRGRWKLVSRRSTTRNCEARRDEQIGLAVAGSSSPCAPPLSSARSEVVPTARTRPPAQRGIASTRRRRNRVALAVHAVLVDVVDAHRLERAGADVQRDVARSSRRVALKRVEHRLVEVQARGRRGDRARRCGVDGLVALGVARHPARARCRAAAARAPWRSSTCVERLGRSARGRARLRALDHLDRTPSPTNSSAPGARRVARADQRQRLVRAERRARRTARLAAASLAPGRRALITRVSFRTTTSRAPTRPRQVGEVQVRDARRSPRPGAAGGSRCARGAGCCAISSAGSS